MVVVIGARDARRRFAELMGRVGNEKEVAIIERFGKPLVALIPIEVYEKLVPNGRRVFRYSIVYAAIYQRSPKKMSKKTSTRQLTLLGIRKFDNL